MQKKIETRFAVGAESVDELDGVTAWFKDYWFNVRASKTEPLLRLNVEAKDTATLNKVKDEVIGFLLENGAVRK
jgi:phosphomannomutase